MVRKIKTLVVIDNLYTGGVATSLYNYLYFAHELMDIHLLIMKIVNTLIKPRSQIM